jgi:hypothetical protein
MRLSDDLVVVVLARILGSIARQLERHAAPAASIPLDPEIVRDLDPQLPTLFAAVQRAFERAFLEAMARARLHLLTLVDALDLDTLRLLGMLGPESSAASALAHVDLLAALASPEANDVVNFSLELLPSILETRKSPAAGTHAVHGYAGIGTKGSLDSMVLTELVWDNEELTRRLLENELLYYAREQAKDDARRLHYLVIDASASMRGDRQVFARGLAIALGKKLQLAGEDVWMRFCSRSWRPRSRCCVRAISVIRSSTSSRTRRSTSPARSSPRSRAKRTCLASSSCRAAARSISITSICWTATPSSITRR